MNDTPRSIKGGWWAPACYTKYFYFFCCIVHMAAGVSKVRFIRKTSSYRYLPPCRRCILTRTVRCAGWGEHAFFRLAFKRDGARDVGYNYTPVALLLLLLLLLLCWDLWAVSGPCPPRTNVSKRCVCTRCMYRLRFECACRFSPEYINS